jgi:hypothetical protein
MKQFYILLLFSIVTNVVIGQCTSGEQPNLLSNNGATCPGTPYQLIVSNQNSLNDNMEWTFYTDSCGGEILASNASGVLDTVLWSNATFYVQATGGCAADGQCQSFTTNLDNLYFPEPDITSVSLSSDSIVFYWSVQWGSPTGWQYSLDSGQVWVPVPVSIDSLVLSGLTPQSCHDILVRPTGGSSACSYNSGSFHSECTQCLNSTGTDVQTACDSYTWIDGNTYTSSNNSATWLETNAAGCDSLVTLDLTITNSNSGTDVQTACDSYTWVDGITYTASNNSATWIETNEAGCDSLVTLDLTITNSNSGTDVQTACDSYTWIDGNTYTSSNNSATWIETNTAGCDSIITLDLTINPLPDNNVTQAGSLLTADQTGATYQWLDCNDNNAIINGETNQSYTPTPITGDYAVEVTLNGCVDTSACFLVDYTGLSDLYAELISIHPNPTSDVLTISGLNEVKGFKGMEITSSTGEIAMKSNDLEDELNVSDLSTGVYFLNIIHEEGIEIVRFVKQ